MRFLEERIGVGPDGVVMIQLIRLGHSRTNEARRQSVQLVADATDGSVSDTQATLDAARAKANKEAEGVAKEGQKVVEAIESSAADRKDKAVAHLLEKVNSQ